MKANTRLFGEVDIEEVKIITLEKGMIGFPDLKKFTLIFDVEKEKNLIKWLQSMDDPDIAFPVVEPTEIIPEYNPVVNHELLAGLGEVTTENIYVLTTITVPKNIEKMSVNLKAPIVINTDTRKGCQMIVEDDFPVRYQIYHLLKEKKEKAVE